MLMVPAAGLQSEVTGIIILALVGPLDPVAGVRRVDAVVEGLSELGEDGRRGATWLGSEGDQGVGGGEIDAGELATTKLPEHRIAPSFRRTVAHRDATVACSPDRGS